MRQPRRNRRKKERTPIELPVIHVKRWLVAGIALVTSAAAVYVLSVALDQPFRLVTVEAPFQRVSTMQVEAAIRDSVSGGFVTVNLSAIRSAVNAIPWVDRAEVQRIWPDQLHVAVVEQVAAARWGDHGLLNSRGELFISDARHPPPELPQLTGPRGSHTKVARRYLHMRNQLQASGLTLTSVALDVRGAWRLVLSNGLEIRLGRTDVDERMKRFLEVVTHVIELRIEDIAYVDMRYSNGFAVGWRMPIQQDGPSRVKVANNA